MNQRYYFSTNEQTNPENIFWNVPEYYYISAMKTGKKPQKQGKKGILCTNLRLPIELANEVKERAKQNDRSLNSQIIYELKMK